LALRVLDHVQYDPIVRGRVTLEAVAWDRPGSEVPLVANLGPQASVNISLGEPAECDIVVVILWARMGTPPAQLPARPDGNHYRSGTEWEFWNAWESAKRHGKPQILVYRRSEVPAVGLEDPDKTEIEQQWKLVKGFFEDLTDLASATRVAVNFYETPSDFESVFEAHLKTLIRTSLDVYDEGSGDEAKPCGGRTLSFWEGSPFPGLAAFTAADAAVFFGRNRETDDLLRLLAKDRVRFVAVVGASGSGKSSLVAAGLMPRLLSGAVSGSSNWVVVRFTPAEVGDNPFFALALALYPALGDRRRSRRELAEELANGSTKLERLSVEILRSRSPDAEIVLFVDQFEELFRTVSSEYQEPFIALLTEANRAPTIRIVTTIRADFYSHCLESTDLAELLRLGSYPLTAPSAASLFEMITQPALRAGLTFEPGLPARILDDAGAEPGSLPLVAFALAELYDARDADGRLRQAAYDGFGGILGAIGTRAEETFNRLQAEPQRALEEVFRELVQVDDRGLATRGRASYRELCHTPGAATLVDAMTDARLLVRSREDEEPTVEVAHEALFKRWPRLSTWIASVRDDLHLRYKVSQAAEDWDANGRLDSFLWSHDRVAEVKSMIDRLRPRLSDVERTFLGPIRPETMLQELEQPGTTHDRRVLIGERLAFLGDPRRGVGVDATGTPEIVWREVSRGTVELETDDATVTVAVGPSHVAAYLVTFSQYKAFVEAEDGFTNPQWWNGLAQRSEEPSWQLRQLSNHPAEFVSWFEAIAYCRWLSSRLGYDVRLPTEWEWQHVATSGNPEYAYPWGVKWDPQRANTYESRLNRTTAVGMYPLGASAKGVFDLCGNVWEWCLNGKDVARRRVELSGSEPRAIRGGAWAGYQEYARVNRPNFLPPETQHDSLGFRVARSIVKGRETS
jgi:formylglycine-generating enzyme required for sulfatase activity